jgi:invasion protein IalB
MLLSKDRRHTFRRGAAQSALLAAIGLLALGIATPLAIAQQPPPATPPKATQQPKTPAPAQQPAAPAAGGAPVAGGAPAAGGVPAAGGTAAPGADVAAPADQQDQAAWVKLCEKSEQTENKEICLTHHERLDGNSGMVLVAAAVRKVEGEEKETLLVRLPTAIALAIPAGVQIRIDEGTPIALNYTLCYATSCQAETEMTKELFDSMRKGKQMVVAAVNLQRKAIGFPVPLGGFAKSYDGPPVDNAKYQEARRQLMEVIRKRQIELANKAKDQGGPSDGQAQASGQPPGQQPPAQPAPNTTTAAPKKPAAPPTP